jgi:hypothetical protein
MPLLFENKNQEELQLLKEWAKVRAYMETHFGKKPDIQGFLYLIGVNELGFVREFEKEEKQDLIHIGLCKVLEGEFYDFTHTDSDGWPHYTCIKPVPEMFIKMQEQTLKSKIVNYFNTYIF